MRAEIAMEYPRIGGDQLTLDAFPSVLRSRLEIG